MIGPWNGTRDTAGKADRVGDADPVGEETQASASGGVVQQGTRGSAGHREGRWRALRRVQGSRRRRIRAGRAGRRRFLTWRRLLGGLLGLCGLLTAAVVAAYLGVDVPRANDQARAQSNVYLAADGTVLARTGAVNREAVGIGDVPPAVRHAFVAAENKTFYKDSGVDPLGFARGIVNTLRGRGTQSGSTITQQYVKNYYLGQEQTLTRKVKEMIIAFKISRHESKDDILAGYLNTTYFGRNAYGIQAAARAYYDTDVQHLTVAQGAYLTALVQAPSQYDWFTAGPTAKKLVRQRWDYVLDHMVKQGWLDRDARQALRFPVPVAPRPVSGLGGQAGYFVDAAQRQLVSAGVSEEELAAGGWTITLTIDPDRQRALERAVRRRGAGGRHEQTGKRASADADVQTGAVSVDPSTGRIVALYGGEDYTRHYLSNATRADYQAGPAFTPILYAAAFTDTAHHGTPSAAYGPGLPAVDPAAAKKTAVALGMDPDTVGFVTRSETMRRGLMGASPLDMAGVYATLDRKGWSVTPAIVASLRRGEQQVRLRSAPTTQAVSSMAARAVDLELLDFPARGPHERQTGIGHAFPLAWVTSGRSDDGKAAWYVGYTPGLVTVVAAFGERHGDHAQIAVDDEHGARPGEIWRDYTTAASGAPASGDDVA